MGIRIRSIEDKEYFFDVRENAGGSDDVVLREIWDTDTYLTVGTVSDGVVMDIGANIGAYSIHAIACGAKHVHAFEPDVGNLERLRVNIALNMMEDRITVHPYAVADQEGVVRMVSGQGASVLRTSPQSRQQPADCTDHEVVAITFEQAIARTGVDSFITLKIDCEGSEYLFVPTASREDLRRFERIRLEFHTAPRGEYGELVTALSPVFNMHLFGSFDRGGQIYGERM